MRRLTRSIAICALAALAGCAGMMGAPSGRFGPPADPGTVTLRLETPPILAEVVGVPYGSDVGSREAGNFLARCAWESLRLEFLFVVGWAGCAVATPIVGAVAANNAAATDDVGLSTAVVSDTVAIGPLRGGLYKAIEETSTRHSPGRLVDAGAATSELVIRTASVQLIGSGKPGTPVSIGLLLDVAVTRRSDGTVVKSTQVAFSSEARPLTEWSADNGALAAAVLAREVPRLARAIVDFAFLLYPFPFQGLADPTSWYTGLQADLGLRVGSFFDPMWPEVKSVRPTLRWEAFPREVDRKADPTMARVRNVTYDLVVAEAADGAVGPTVYDRTGLTGIEHALEIDLAPRARYYWTVRPRFEVDGQVYVAEWSARGGRATRVSGVPNTASYAFRTP